MKFSKYKKYSDEELLNDLKLKNDLNNYKDNGKHIFDWAISEQKGAQIINHLQEQCGPNFHIDALNRSPLMIAIMRNNASAFRIILNYNNVDLTQKDNDGWNALHHAVRQ